MSEVKVLEKLFPRLCDSLNTDEVKPHLVQSGAITIVQYEELQLGINASIASQHKLAEKTLIAISRDPRCATKLLQALEQTKSARNEESSHYHLVIALREEIERYKCQIIPPHQGQGEVVSSDGPQFYPNKIEGVRANTGASNEPVPLVQYDYLQSKEVEKLRVKLVQESRQIMENYTAFTLKVGDLLESKSVTPDRVSTVLRYRLGSKNIDKNTSSMMREAKNVHSLLCAVEPFSSWYNHDLIALLAKELGGQEGEKLVELYESQLTKHFHRLVYECPPFSSFDSIPEDFEEMTVKVEWDYKECSLQDITIFKGKLCKFLGREDPSQFILKSVEEGCVLLTWLFPCCMTADVTREVQAHCSEFAAERVAFVRVGTKIISCVCSDQTQETQVLGIPKSPTLTPPVVSLSEVPTSSSGLSSESARGLSKPDVSLNFLRTKQKNLSPGASPSIERPLSPLVDSNCKATSDLSPASPVANTKPQTDSSHPFPKVQLREKRLYSRLLEQRHSSGYYSPHASIADSPTNSQRSSWAVDTSSRASSGYNSPVQSERTSLVVMAEEDEGVGDDRAEGWQLVDVKEYHDSS